jgi:IS5 family transposase
MVDRVEANCGQRPTVVSADAGYFSRDNVAACEQRGVDPYIAVGRERKGAPPASADPVRERMRTKLRSALGKAIYARRKAIVEPPFGQIKQARGFRRFSLRGIPKVRTEWTFVCLTHNLLKLFRAPRAGWPALAVA